LQRAGFLTEKLRRIHECRDYKGPTTPAKLRLCDNCLEVVREQILRVLRVLRG
jgi:hypothetical protein